ncbi:hypothetical protein RJ640_002008, partial [Escallonia rubra]
MSLRGILLAFVLATMLCWFATSDDDKDKEECTEQLVGLATCLPYVGGNAKAPTPDCCSGLKQVLKVKKKCLCVIVKDRNDPDLGLTINVTLALGLPSVCHAPANLFYIWLLIHQMLRFSINLVKAPILVLVVPHPVVIKANSTTATSSSGTPSVPQKSDGCRGTGKRWLELE